MIKRMWHIVAVLLAMALPAVAAGQSVVEVSAKASKAAVAPGEQFAIAVIFDHEEGWHIHTNEPVVPADVAFMAIKTEVIPKAPLGLEFWPVQWPASHAIQMQSFTGGSFEYEVFDGRAIAYLPLRLPADSPAGGTADIELEIRYQACDDKTCLQPVELTLTVKVMVVEEAEGSAAKDADFAGFAVKVFGEQPEVLTEELLQKLLNPEDDDPSSGTVGPREGESEASSDPASRGSAGSSAGAAGAPAAASNDQDLGFGVRIALTVPLVLLFGLIGGFVLNLTPCVLPVIPLKIMGLSQAAAGSRGRCLFLGAMSAAGILAFWVFIGFLIAGVKVIPAVSSLFANPWFGLGIGAFIAIMALGMMGAYTLQLPQSVYRVTPKHDTAAGSFLFGIMTAVLGTPCFGPFVGGAAGWATKQSTLVALSAFAAIGVGMALPYLVLAARPQWINRVPRTGPGSELVKQVMGLLLLAAAAFFLGAAIIGLVAERPYLSSVIHWWFVALFAGVAGLWLLFRVMQISRKRGPRVVFALLGLFITVVSVMWAQWQTSMYARAYVPVQAQGQGVWRPFDPVAYQQAIDAGEVAVTVFTAEWCINCKILEAAVLMTPSVQETLHRPGVAAFKADLTSRNAPGWAKLYDLGEVGIPLLSIEGPGHAQPWKSNAYTPEQVVSGVESGFGRGPRQQARR
jgi:thiol:disulfide interchange protein